MRVSLSIPPDAYVMVIGAMKSGTSTFFAHLTSHPEVAPSRDKEPEYFSEFQGHGLDVDRYQDLWEFDPDLHRYCAEASTGYTKYPSEPHVPDRILAAGIQPRFIYLVRDPIARMESQLNHGFLRRTSWAWDDFLDPEILDLSRYYMQLQQFLLRFPDRSRYRILDFDDLISEPQKLMDEVFRWLGLEPVRVNVDHRENPAPKRTRLQLLLADVDLSIPRRLLPGWVRTRLKSWLMKGPPVQRRMTAAEREKARRYLKRDIQLFGEEFDFNVAKWGF